MDLESLYPRQEGTETCEHCSETDGLHEHDGDLLCDTHLEQRLAH
jgi:hypothetical protein